MVHHTWVYKKLNWYSTSSAGKCLESLFALGRHAPKHISKHCTLKPATEISIYQATHSMFSVFLPSRQDIKVNCGKGMSSQTWEGLVRVQLTDGCMAAVGSYQFYPTPSVKDSTMTVTRRELVLEDYVEPAVLDKWHQLNNSTLTPVARTLEQAEADFETELIQVENTNRRSFLWWMGLATASLLGTVIVVLIGVWCFPCLKTLCSKMSGCAVCRRHSKPSRGLRREPTPPRRRQRHRDPVYGNTTAIELRKLKPRQRSESLPERRGSVSDNPDPERVSLATNV